LTVLFFLLAFEFILLFTPLLVDVSLVIAPFLAQLLNTLKHHLLIAFLVHLNGIVTKPYCGALMAISTCTQLLRAEIEPIIEFFSW
jgi:hypothetical protein